LPNASGTTDFVNYSPATTNGDYHLTASATSLIGQGTNLSGYFTTDKDGNARPATGSWDIGPYEYAVPGPSTNPVSVVSPGNLDFGAVVTNSSTNQVIIVQNTGGGTLTGTASVLAPFQIVSGGSYSLGSNQTQTVTIGFNPTVAGTFSQTVTFTGGNGASVGVTGVAYVMQPNLAFSSGAGTIIAPFAVSNMSPIIVAGTTVNSYVSQGSTTGLSGSGEAVYGFSITNTDNYAISAIVSAPGDGNNSFYVNIDGQPTDPTMIWDVPVTSGFTNLLVSWRGTGTDTNNQYIPKVFGLSAGAHQLIVRGRESGTQLAYLTIIAIPPAPTGLHVLSP
jgi:hypothetical protein